MEQQQTGSNSHSHPLAEGQDKGSETFPGGYGGEGLENASDATAMVKVAEQEEELRLLKTKYEEAQLEIRSKANEIERLNKLELEQKHRIASLHREVMGSDAEPLQCTNGLAAIKQQHHLFCNCLRSLLSPTDSRALVTSFIQGWLGCARKVAQDSIHHLEVQVRAVMEEQAWKLPENSRELTRFFQASLPLEGQLSVQQTSHMREIFKRLPYLQSSHSKDEETEPVLQEEVQDLEEAFPSGSRFLVRLYQWIELGKRSASRTFYDFKEEDVGQEVGEEEGKILLHDSGGGTGQSGRAIRILPSLKELSRKSHESHREAITSVAMVLRDTNEDE